MSGPVWKKWLDLAPLLGAILLALIVGYLLGRLITERRTLPHTPMTMRDLGRSSVPTVHIDGVFNGQIRGMVRGEARLFLAGDQILPDQSGAFLTPAGPFLVNNVTITVPAGMRFVASKRGQKYYAITSASAANLAPENRVYFSSEEEAEGAGYRK
ncbi:MAG: hypothetical protein PHZ25_03150 [Candidatus Pacebacteria bacterium]|nr:hypothetical protein [Candidatus Paceibacterota bacterium]